MLKEMTYDEFIDQYKPIKNQLDEYASFDGTLFETFGDELASVLSNNPRHIFTLIEDLNSGELFVVNGPAWVNRLGYFITENPWNLEDEITVKIQ